MFPVTRWFAAALWVAVVAACGGEPEAEAVEEPVSHVTPFVNVAPTALVDGHEVWNDRPGVAIFDFDRDGDLDLYVTAEAEHANWLYRNEGDGIFSNVARSAGVMAVGSHSTGAVACDLDNDGYQDLYVGAWGSRVDGLDFRSPSEGQGNRDSLFRNNGDGTFEDVTMRPRSGMRSTCGRRPARRALTWTATGGWTSTWPTWGRTTSARSTRRATRGTTTCCTATWGR